MKTFNLFLSGFLMLALIFSSCKKKNDEIPPPTTAKKQSDQSATSAVDSSLEDVNDVINNRIGGGSNARTAAYKLPCGVISVDSTTTSNGKKVYIMKYGDQNNCDPYRKKSGDISFKLESGNSFRDSAAIFSVTYTNYVVEVTATNDIVTVNGTIYVTNVNGGFIWQAVTDGRTINHKIRGKLTVTFANNQVRERNYYQFRTWSSNSDWASLKFNVAGDTLINGVKVSETGRTIDGNYEYRTEIINDFLWSNCGSTWAGPYVLKTGHGRMNITVPNISPAYFEIEAGYYIDYLSGQTEGSKVSNCTSNTYKINVVLGTTQNTQYQLY